MQDEIGDNLICPNTKQIEIQGNLFQVISGDGATFNVYITQTDEGLKSVNLYDSIIQTQVMTRYFDPVEYKENGYSTPVIKEFSISVPEQY